MRGIIFDFNGTLFDDTGFHIASWQRYLRDRFSMELTRAQIIRICVGADSEAIFKTVLGPQVTREEARAYGLEKEIVYRSIVLEDPKNLRLIEGAPELLDLLSERGIPFAVATSSEIDNVDFYTESLGISRWFTPERIAYIDGRVPSKPDPAFYTDAAARLGLLPRDCLIVEDSRSGIAGAVNAGAGRIIAMDRTLGRDVLLNMKEVSAIIHDYRGFDRFLEDMRAD